MTCSSCGSTRSVQAIKTGFQVSHPSTISSPLRLLTLYKHELGYDSCRSSCRQGRDLNAQSALSLLESSCSFVSHPLTTTAVPFFLYLPPSSSSLSLAFLSSPKLPLHRVSSFATFFQRFLAGGLLASTVRRLCTSLPVVTAARELSGMLRKILVARERTSCESDLSLLSTSVRFPRESLFTPSTPSHLYRTTDSRTARHPGLSCDLISFP